MSRSAFRISWAFCTIAAVLVPAGAARADLRFATVTVNLGDIRSSMPLACQFHFVNESSGTLELVEVRPGCGCIKPRLEKLRFGPGEQGAIALEVHTLGQSAGPHTWDMTLLYKVGNQIHQQVLQVRGNVITEVSVQPGALTLVVEGAMTHELTLTDLRAHALTIAHIESTSPWLHGKASPLARDTFGHFTSKIRVEIAESCPPGRHDESLVIHTNDPAYRELKVAVTVIKRPTAIYTVTPAEVKLGGTSCFVRLAHHQDRPMVVESVTADNPGVVCHWALGPGNHATVRLEIDRAKWRRGSPSEVQVRVQIKSPVREEVLIPVHVE